MESILRISFTARKIHQLRPHLNLLTLDVYSSLINNSLGNVLAVSRSGYIRHLHSGPPSSLLRTSKATTSEQPVLKMSSTGDDEMLTSRCPGVSTRPGHTSHSRPQPSSPEVDNGINSLGIYSLSYSQDAGLLFLWFLLCLKSIHTMPIGSATQQYRIGPPPIPYCQGALPISIVCMHLYRLYENLILASKVCGLSHYIIIIIITVFYPRAGLSLQAQEPRLQFCRRQVFHRKLRNQGCSFTRDWIGAVAAHCFLHPSLSLASEQVWQILLRGSNFGLRFFYVP